MHLGDAVTASGELDAIRYVDVFCPSGIVVVLGIGYSYDEIYYAKSVTHKIKRGEFKPSFTLACEGLGPLTLAVMP